MNPDVQRIILFKIDLATLKVSNVLTVVENTKITHNLCLSMLLTEGKISQIAVYEVNPYPMGP